MKCNFYCVADGYQMDGLVKKLKDLGYEPRFYDNVVHFYWDIKERTQDVFIFSYGCPIFWGVLPEEEIKALALFKPFELGSLVKPIQDESRFLYGDQTEINEEEDEIILESRDSLIKLSFSHAMSQSVKLRAFEESTDITIERNRHLPQVLAENGHIPLSRKKLSKKIGSLFAERNSINLHSDILDTPEFFWRRPRYEPYYIMASQYMDITTRLDILNKRLDALHELYEILSNQLNHRHSIRIEIIIVLLISFEVILVILKDFLRWV